MEEERVGLSYFCAVLYPLILAGVCYYVYSINEASLVGLILGIILSIATGVAMAVGGFYLIIIPLPYIFFYRGGCVKHYQPTWRKTLCAVSAILCPILVFIALFVTQ